jgi:hypothetical protein
MKSKMVGLADGVNRAARRLASRGPRVLLALGVAAGMLSPAIVGPVPVSQAADCQFLFGFKALRDLIPSTVGDCVSDETHNPENGDGLQQTTGGLMVWRKADNWTAFTDGSTTWINGPLGLQSRPNAERFSWEGTAPVASPAAAAPAPAPVETTAPPPPPPPAAERPLDQLVLNLEDAGEKTKASGRPRSGSDNRASWYEVTYRRDSDRAVLKLGPQYVVNRVYRATDAATAQQIYNEQINAGFPEAKTLNLFPGSVGGQQMNPIGEAAQAIGGCESCNDDNPDRLMRHYRIVFRMGNLVQTVYTYGSDSGAYFGVAFDLAKKVEKRVLTAPSGPLQEIFSTRQPADIGLHLEEAGKQAVEVLSRTGSDGRSSWYESRYERGEETVGQKLGPATIYNKIFVANSADDARAIYRENAVKDLPQATQPRGGIFTEDKTKKFGNESYAIGACNNDCGDNRTEYLHEQVVYRWGNVVVVVYIWGQKDEANPETLGLYAGNIAGRIQ